MYVCIYTYTHYLLYKIEKFWEMHLNITVVKAFHLLELRALFWIGYFKTKGMMSPYLEDEGSGGKSWYQGVFYGRKLSKIRF